MTASKDQVRAAITALGYDPAADNIMSIYADTDQVIVRRIENAGGFWAMVEDVTVLNPNTPAKQRPDGDLGPLAPHHG